MSSAISAAQDHEKPFICTGSPNQLLIIADEAALISALDTKQILSWQDFEYVLSLVIENRILRLYQAHLDRMYQERWKEELDDLENLTEEGNKKKKKKRKQKKRNKKTEARS